MAQVCHRENSQNITARKFRSYIAFRIFVYSVIKKTGQPGPEKLRLNVRRFSVHASSYHHEPVHLTTRMLSSYNIHFYCNMAFSDFFTFNRHTQKILYFYLIAKRTTRLFWNGKHILTLSPGHFVSGVTGPEHRWITGLHYYCRNFITNSHTSSLQPVYLRLSHHL